MTRAHLLNAMRALAACALLLYGSLAAAQVRLPSARDGTPPVPATVGAEPAVVNLAMPSAIGADYKIGPNDLLEVEVFGVSELKRTVRVNATGQVALPLIGSLQLAGLTTSDAEALIAIKYGAKYLQDPQVSIFIKEFTTQRITVDGAVVKPGIFPLTGQITLLRALALAGGGGPMADLEQVMLFRIGADGKPVSEKYDALKIRSGQAPDPLLQGDDIVVVNRDSKRTALRDSFFRDLLDTLNPFSQAYRGFTP
jgi:polysaccharide export outer membrane protein